MINKSTHISRRNALRMGGWMTLFGFCLGRHPTCLAPYLAADAKEAPSPLGRTFYVATWGNDSAPGTSQRPFRTITGALGTVPNLGRNDTIIVMPGIYTEHVVVDKGGDPTGYLTLRSYIKHRALIRSPRGTYSAVNIITNFVVIDGFDVQARGTGHGIEATFFANKPENDGPHHVKILNNLCHHNPGSGISASYGDFFTIEGNICHNNCYTNKYQGSGISIYEARAISDQTPGFHNFVRNNICYQNIALDLPGHPEPPHSDANGIIIDDFQNSQTRNRAGNYRFSTLVENNVVYSNGGKGIQIYFSDNVVVRNNTSYHNNLDLLNPGTWRGELSNVMSGNNVWVNNIAVADPEINKFNTAIGDNETNVYSNNDVFWYNNLTFDGIIGEASLNISGSNRSLTTLPPYNNIFGLDPRFVNEDNELAPNFHLRADSPAVNAGTTALGTASTDLDGNPRIASGKVDIGAYEEPG